jgi:hypothetical protein
MDRATVTDRDAAVIAVLRSSALARTAGRVVEAFARAARHSAARSMWSPIAEAWRGYDRSRRLRSIGIALVTAVIVHVGLLALQPLPGWRAFVVPAIALAQGLLLIVSSPATRLNR